MNDTNATFASWLRNARTEAGMSQQKVADAMRAAGFDTFRQTKVLKIEQEKTAIFLEEAVALAALFGQTLDSALGLRPLPPQYFSTALDLARRTELLRLLRAQIDTELGATS